MGEVFVNLFPLSPEQRLLFERLAPDAEHIYSSYHEVTPEQLQRATVIFGYPPVKPLAQVKNLRWLQLSTAGADRYLPPGVLPETASLSNATGAYGPAVSEHMLGMLMTLYKKMHLYRDNQRKALWKDRGKVRSITGKTVLILGAGDIGSAFARLVRALGASSVIGIKRNTRKIPEGFDEAHPLERLDELLPKADIVANVLPATPETERLFDGRRLSLLRSDAVLLNCGRGSAVDLDALCVALEKNPEFCAGLDVTEPEPLPAEHPIWMLPNVLITPHAAGNFHLDSILELLLEIALKNLASYQETGQPCVNVLRLGKRP